MNILIVKPSSLGDIIHVFPALELLRRRYPDAVTDFLVHPAFAGILDYSPLAVRRKILFERGKLGCLRTFPGAFLRLYRELRETKYDLVIDFQGLLRSGFFAWLSRRVGPVVGFADPREAGNRWFCRRRFPVAADMHAIERNVALANALLGTADPVPGYVLPAHPEYELADLRSSDRGAVGIIPGARWASKQFPETLFADVIRKLREARPGVIFRIVGSPGEREAEKKIMELVGDTSDIEPLAGRTSLGGMVEVLRRCDAVLCNDSGPMHAAAALGVPVVAFFGPTHPELTGPYGANCRVVRAEGESCLGCMRRECGRSDPPRCHRLSADAVAGMVLAHLTAPANGNVLTDKRGRSSCG